MSTPSTLWQFSMSHRQSLSTVRNANVRLELLDTLIGTLYGTYMPKCQCQLIFMNYPTRAVGGSILRLSVVLASSEILGFSECLSNPFTWLSKLFNPSTRPLAFPLYMSMSTMLLCRCEYPHVVEVFATPGCTLNASTWIVILVDLSVRPLATNTIAIHQRVRSQSRGSCGWQLALLIYMRH